MNNTLFIFLFASYIPSAHRFLFEFIVLYFAPIIEEYTHKKSVALFRLHRML